MGTGLERKLDYSDYVAIPDDGKRYEIVRGALYVTPSPSPHHQRISKRLQVQLMAYFEQRRLGEVFNAPLDVILTDNDIVQPDLLVVADPDQVSDRGIERAPLLVIEILSPSTASKDREVKMPLYAHYGVAFAWLLDPRARTLEAYQLEGDAWQEIGRYSGADKAAVPPFEAVTLDLDGLWLPIQPQMT